MDRFIHRGVKFHKTDKGYWFFDEPPDTCVAWERYATDEEAAALSSDSVEIDRGVEVLKRMIDRKFAGEMIYKGDLRYRVQGK
jgi:hypothetical protein